MIMKMPFIKKIDSAGRISIPSKLRFLLGLMAGDLAEFTVIIDNKDRVYLAVECKRAIPQVVSTIQTAIEAGEFDE